MSRAAATLLLAVIAAGGCAPKQGWQRTDRRACSPQSAPVLCLTDEVEGPLELRLGARVLLPGECIEGPADGGGGQLRVSLYRSGQRVSRPRVRVRPGWRTVVAVEDTALEVVSRDRCDDAVPGEP
ncbi:MAG: hypothetical protein K0V04_32930 [Deltaproteobacteria bacterium]|nr:hypothetical protein [Deltaproteobacteria bacterium]